VESRGGDLRAEFGSVERSNEEVESEGDRERVVMGGGEGWWRGCS
jgi:hypothetical protein